MGKALARLLRGQRFTLRSRPTPCPRERSKPKAALFLRGCDVGRLGVPPPLASVRVPANVVLLGRQGAMRRGEGSLPGPQAPPGGQPGFLQRREGLVRILQAGGWAAPVWAGVMDGPAVNLRNKSAWQGDSKRLSGSSIFNSRRIPSSFPFVSVGLCGHESRAGRGTAAAPPSGASHFSVVPALPAPAPDGADGLMGG